MKSIFYKKNFVEIKKSPIARGVLTLDPSTPHLRCFAQDDKNAFGVFVTCSFAAVVYGSVMGMLAFPRRSPYDYFCRFKLALAAP